MVQHAPHEFMHDNEVLPRSHPFHESLGGIFMLSNDTASGTAPSGEDLSAKSTHQATVPNGQKHARGRRSLCNSISEKVNLHAATICGPPGNRSIPTGRYLACIQNFCTPCGVKILCTLMPTSWHTTSTPKQGLSQGWQSGPLARYGKSL